MFGCESGSFLHVGGWLSTMLLFSAGVILTWLALRLTKKKPLSTDRSDSLEILKIRLAKGEITLSEYSTLKTAL